MTTISESESVDVLVVGAGMGGSIVAGRCAEAGLRTLVLEKGASPSAGGHKPSLFKRVLGTAGSRNPERWDTAMAVRSREAGAARDVNPQIGVGPGGSGRIYGAALGRGLRADFEEDFQPDSWGYPATALRNDWPVSYDEFLIAYREAETLLGVTGTHDPLDPDDDAPLRPPPPLSPAHEEIMIRLREAGRHPFRMHTGIAYRPGCSECQGVTCERDCKAHGFNRCLLPAMRRQAPVALKGRVRVHAIAREPDGNWRVDYETPDDGVRKAVAPTLVLAAGALNTPRLLLGMPDILGGKVPHLVGRGLMFHGLEMFAVWPSHPGDLYGPRKVIAFRDHYRDGAMPLGEVQSLGIVSNAGMISSFIHQTMRKYGLGFGNLGRLPARAAGAIGQRLFAGAELFYGALQDLPYETNRVSLPAGSGLDDPIAITYRPAAEYLARTKRFRKLTREAFAPLRVQFTSPPGEMNFGHPMGTCRMGHSPDHSVVDASGKVWDQDRLFIADASVFSSALGINPALTVAAHALRVARAIAGDARR